MRKKYASQLRYEKNNPTITFRMTIKEKELIQNMALRSGISVSRLVRMALLDLEMDFSEGYEPIYNSGKKDGEKIGYDNGYEDGHKKGKEEWMIWVPCCFCHQNLYIQPNTENHQRVFDEMKGRLSHQTCPSGI